MKNYFLLILVSIAFNFNANAQLAGTLNTSFSQDGWDDSVFGNDNGFEIKKTLIQPDGKILVCARANLGEPTQAIITRYNPNGTIDMSFGGGDGVVRSKEDASIDLFSNANGMILQSNGKIIVAGNSFGACVIFRLNADGSFDTTFATDGIFEITGGDLENIIHVSVQSDDKIIVCGEESRFVNGILVNHIFLWRFTENGVLDTTFGNAGDVSYTNSTWADGNEIYLNLNDLIILPDDKIVINQSYTALTSSYVMLRKLNANGTLDTSFGTNGEFIKSETINDGTYKNSSSSIQSNGSIVTSFTSRDIVNSNYIEKLFRVNAQGVLDESFNVSLDNATTFTQVIQVISSGEKIYVFKKATEDFSSFDQINCYDLIGNLVNTFGTNGIALINQNNIPISEPSKAAVSSNGNIYIVSSISKPSLGNVFFVSNINGFNPNLSSTTNLIENKTIVYPNPTNGIVTISNSENIIIDKIELVDTLGKIISVETENTSQINLSAFSKGIYIVKMYSGNSISQKRIIKQ